MISYKRSSYKKLPVKKIVIKKQNVIYCQKKSINKSQPNKEKPKQFNQTTEMLDCLIFKLFLSKREYFTHKETSQLPVKGEEMMDFARRYCL